jgi:exonuclease III
MNKKNKQSLQVCQINISGLSKHSLTALDNYNHSIKNDVLAVQETLLTTSNATNNAITGMESFALKNDRGVMLCIQPWLLPQKVDELQDNISDAIWATAKVGNLTILIGNIYVNPGADSSNNLDAAVNNISKAIEYREKFKIKELIVLGDFNCRNTLWKDSITNNRGRLFEKFVNQHQLACIFPNSKTFICGSGGSVIDLALIKNGKLSDLYQTSSVDSEIELFTGAPIRGHLPVVHSFNLPSSFNNASKFPTTIYRDLKKTDWSCWQGVLSDKLDNNLIPHLKKYTDPSHLWNDFIAILNHVNDVAIPKKTASAHSKPFWTTELSQMSKEVQLARSKMMARHTPINADNYRVIKSAFAEQLVAEKNKWIHEQLDGLNVADSLKFWKNYRHTIVGTSNDFIGNLYDGGILHTETSQKEETLYQSFFSGNHMKNGNFDASFGTKVDKEYSTILQSCYKSNEDNPSALNDNPSALNESIRMEELIQSIKALKSSAKSFDIDDLHPTIIKQLPRSAIVSLLTLFNLTLDTGIWAWDTSNVTFIKKTGKDNYMKPGSYRPITISSYIGKLLEKIIEQRLRKFCELNGILDEEQEGFRSKRNTSRYLYKMISRLDESKRKKMTTLLLCIDFSKAFDSVWVNGLIAKLYNYKIRGKVLKVIDTFLQSKRVRLKINGVYGKTRTCGTYGLPQGSVLAPLLFIIYISDMFTHMPLSCREHTSVYKYADDGTAASSHTSATAAHSLCQEVCDHLSRWCSLWRMIPNCDKDKTECIILYPLKQTSYQFCKLRICGKEINYVEKSTVLGLTIDKDLSFERHASTKLSQCWFAWYNITKNCTRKWGLNASSLTILFKSVVLTKLLYAAPIWLKGNIDTFKDFYSRVILKISGATHHPPRELTSIVLDIAPLQIEYEIIVIKFLLKSICSDDNMKALIYQLEESKAHRYQHQIKLLKSFITWKKQCDTRLEKPATGKISLSEDMSLTPVMQYTKEEIRLFKGQIWYNHTNLEEDLSALTENPTISKRLLPRHSSRKTDTQVLSLIHGRDMAFMKFRFTIKRNVSPFCQTCQRGCYDDNYHRLLVCPKFNSSYRDNIHKAIKESPNDNKDPIISILLNGQPETLSDFRIMAQITMSK